MTVVLTREAWKRFAPGCPPTYTDALFSSLDLLERSGLFANELRWCHFAATVFEETGNFREIRESLRYTTCKALRSTWPSRFGHKSDDELRPLLKNERALAGAVYGGRMGNATAEDAFSFRGGGWIQTTGREAVERYCGLLNIQPGAHTLDDPLTTLKFAALEWVEAKCNTWADENSLRKVAKAINTGSAASHVEPVGMDERKKAFARAWAIWGDTGTADVPASMSDVGAKIQAAAVKVGGPVVAASAAAAHIVTQPSASDAIAMAQNTLTQAQQVKSIAIEARSFIPSLPPQILVPGAILALGLIAAYVIHRRGS